jgi:uncharacterized protein YdaU (DUF1376 family)
MAKDPAFLFYTGDFLSGTMFFTNEQVGMYLRLLMAQHQHGRLSEKQVKIICNSFDIEVMEKFEKDESGNYYNLRLELEIDKRKSFSESRSNNRKGKTKQTKKEVKKKSLTYDNHMEDKDRNKDSNKKEDKIELVMPFDSEKFLSTWKVLCNSKKWRGKSIEALQASLLKLSENNERDAIQMMLNSIAGEWQGIFELKNNTTNGKQAINDSFEKAIQDEYISAKLKRHSETQP